MARAAGWIAGLAFTAGVAMAQGASPTLRLSADPTTAPPVSNQKSAGTAPSVQPLRPMPLMPEGQVIEAGDLLRTTRVFPNWNLNCEVVISQARHICAVETRSVDAKGRDLFAWSVALSTENMPIMIFKVPGDIDRSYGLRMNIGAFGTTFVPGAGDCTANECRIIAPFDAALRGLAAAQDRIAFSLMRDGVVSEIRAPIAGLGQALEMARRDPIGLAALGGAQKAAAVPARARQQARPPLAAKPATTGRPATRTAAIPR